MSDKSVQLQHQQHSNVSFLSKVGTTRSRVLFLVHGEDKGRPAWYYIMVDKLKLPMLQRDSTVKSNTINLQQYGEVIKYGWGIEPPASIAEYIEKDYK